MPGKVILSEDLSLLYFAPSAKTAYGWANQLVINRRDLLDSEPRSKWGELLSNLPNNISHVELKIKIKEDELKDFLKALPQSVTEISLSFWDCNEEYIGWYCFMLFHDGRYASDFKALYRGKPSAFLSLFPFQIRKIHLLDTSLYFCKSTNTLREREDLAYLGFSTETGKSLSFKHREKTFLTAKLCHIHLSSSPSYNYTVGLVAARFHSVDIAKVIISCLDKKYENPDCEVLGPRSNEVLQEFFRRTEVVAPKGKLVRVVLDIKPNGQGQVTRRVFEADLEAGFDDTAENWKPDVQPLIKSLAQLDKYGIQLKNTGDATAGNIAQKLAIELRSAIGEYERRGRLDPDFKGNFLKLLHSQDAKMPSYCNDWRVILMNIAIALTGVGLFLVAGKLISTRGAGGFFAETKAHAIRTEAEKSLNRMVPWG